MAKFTWMISLSILVIFLIPEYEATPPLFLQAITSALATIPFTGGPMTTGLVGAKLAIGTKLLYYLGYFGRRSKPTPVPVAKKATPAAGLAGGFQPVPLPYFLSGAGRFPQMGNNFGPQGGFYQEASYGGVDPTQVFLALRAQGYDPNTAMQMMNYGGFENREGFANMPQGFETGGLPNMPQGGFNNMPQGFETGGLPNMPQGGFNNMPQGFENGGFPNMPQGGFNNMPQGFENGGFPNMPQEFKPEDPAENTDSQKPSGGVPEDIESFFTFLRDMDENMCISRLVCDIGADPSFLGDFSENIHSIVKSLDTTATAGASQYLEIMETGKKEGGCDLRFLQCTDSSYEIVKNVAPSVGIPSRRNARESEPEDPAKNTSSPQPLGFDEDVEAFFKYVNRWDGGGKCMFRMVCDTGFRPCLFGDFTANLYRLIGSLDVTPTSAAYPYVEAMEKGRIEGECAAQFPECADDIYGFQIKLVSQILTRRGIPIKKF